MVHIAICDDQPQELETVVTYTADYIEQKRMNAHIMQFTHPDALLIGCETKRFSLYILDIVMPMVNGIEVGCEIRRLDKEAQIIYATSEPSFALEAYAANPINYLLKPINKAKLFHTLDLAFSRLDLAEEETLTLKTKEGLRVISLFTIVCCEFTQRTARYTLANGEAITTRTLQESFSEHMLPLLQDSRFLQPHHAFVLNMSRVEGFSKDGFTMRGGAFIPISSKQYSVVRDRYMDYLMAKDGVKR